MTATTVTEANLVTTTPMVGDSMGTTPRVTRRMFAQMVWCTACVCMGTVAQIVHNVW